MQHRTTELMIPGMVLRRVALFLATVVITAATVLTACSSRSDGPGDSHPDVTPSEKSMSNNGPNSFAPSTKPKKPDDCGIGGYSGSGCLAGMD